MAKLNERQRRFADEYIISGNAYQSAQKAGYSERYAKADSHKLLENTGIKTYISERLADLQSKKVADQQEVLEYLTSVMRGEETEQTIIGVGELGQELTDIEVSAKDRIKAAELLGKRYRLWTDKVEAEVQGTVVFANEDDIAD
ncbi:terminase small subunit [Streptococcus gallolyticus subsp. gallolyticus]|nr:terminase small subunit [Streptococcus gallolyticus]MCY7171771.1 terminase small subunit [Streptococcus gallolyticus subsp. gallolyticus]